MSEGVHRHVHVHMVHAEAIVSAAVHGEAATELVGLLVNRPELFCTQKLSEPIGRHHRSKHAQFGDRAVQFLGGFFRVLHRNNRHAFEA